MRILLIVHHRLWRAAYRSKIIAHGLASRGHQVTLIVTADRERWRFREMQDDGVRIVEAPDLTAGSLRSGWDPVAAFRRHRWIKSQGATFDLIHLFETRPATIFPGLAARKKLGVPLVIDWIDWWGRGGIISMRRPGWYKALFGRVETWFEEHFRTYADATTVISYGLKERAISLGVPPHTIHHLRNGADVRTFKPWPKAEARARVGLPEDKFLIGYAAQDTFFDLEPVMLAFKAFIDKGVNAEFVFSGFAPNKLKKMVEDLRLSDRVNFLGYLPWDTYPYFQASCDSLVVPFPETVYNIGRWPGKFGEYLAAGRPVVFNPVGDLVDFAGSEAPGIPCDFSVEAFADAFETLHDHPQLCDELGARARRLACEQMAWEQTIDRFECLYRELLDQGDLSPRQAQADAMSPHPQTETPAKERAL